MTPPNRPAEPRFEGINRAQCFLQVVDLEELIPEGHRARLLWKVLEELDLSRFASGVKAVRHHAGRDAIAPRLLIAMWLYSYSRGLSSAREIARQSQYEPGLRWLTGDEVVNHHTLSDFRVRHGAALQQLFVQVLGVLSLKQLITLERVTVDGTKIRANTSKKTFSRASKIKEHLAVAKKHIEELQKEEAEREEQGRRGAAQKRATKERVERLESALEEIERLQKEGEGEQVQVSTSEPEARFMRTNDGGLAPSYNVQLATEGSHKLFVGVSVSQQANDAAHLVAAMTTVKEQAGRYPERVLADGDYTNRGSVIAMKEMEIEFIGSWKEGSSGSKKGIAEGYDLKAFHYDEDRNEMICPEGQRLRYRSEQRMEGNAALKIFAADKEVCLACAHRMECSPKNSMTHYGRMVSRLKEDERVAEFQQKMQTAEAKAEYKKRAPIAEFPHAWLKSKFNFTRFRCRGLVKVTAETLWACLAYNLQTYLRLVQAA